MDIEAKLEVIDQKLDDHVLQDVRLHSASDARLVIVDNRLSNVDTKFEELKVLLKDNGDRSEEISKDVKGLKEDKIKREAVLGFLGKHPKIIALIVGAVLALAGVDGGMSLVKNVTQVLTEPAKQTQTQAVKTK